MSLQLLGGAPDSRGMEGRSQAGPKAESGTALMGSRSPSISAGLAVRGAPLPGPRAPVSLAQCPAKELCSWRLSGNCSW